MENVTNQGKTVTIDGISYFIINNTRIIITEHFPEQGATLGELLEQVITHSAKIA